MQITNLVTNNVETTFIQTDKFKTINIQVVFLGHFNKDNATKRSLLSRILPLSTKKYPSKKALYNKLHDLYDMSVGVSTYPTYKTNMTTFSLNYVNPKYIKSDINLHIEAISLLKEIIYNQNIINGGFEKKLFYEQKSILAQNIKNVYNNKNRYALRQLLNHMGKDEIISVSVLGNLEDLEKIDEFSLYETYQDLITKERAYINVIGDFDTEEMQEYLKILGDFNNEAATYEVVSNEDKEIVEVKEYVEKQNLNQAKLMMGFRTKTNSIDPLYPALLVFNAMFGGTFQSDLIRVVREENSLAYTIVSQMIPDLKLLFVSAGIDSNNYKLTKELVEKELVNYQNGKLNLDNMRLAKDSLINELIEIEDSPNGIINFYFRNKIYNQAETLESLLEKITNVTEEQIVEVAKGITLDTIFLLAGDNYEG
ncbi:MAG TPA: insulinase family protein [Acholeplasmataceae bacterium]|nr:insulinase family protein [Acholeplasmataceae bacterium]